MASKLEVFKQLPRWGKLLVLAVCAAVGLLVYTIAAGAQHGANQSHAVTACQDAVNAKLAHHAAFTDHYVTDAAQGRFAVSGHGQAPNDAGIVLAFTYDCLVDGDGSNAEADIFPR